MAVFGLQQSQQQLLCFFNECVKYWEKLEMRSPLGGFGWETDVRKAGGVPEAVDEELISSAGQRTGCDLFCSECYRCVNESSVLWCKCECAGLMVPPQHVTGVPTSANGHMPWRSGRLGPIEYYRGRDGPVVSGPIIAKQRRCQESDFSAFCALSA